MRVMSTTIILFALTLSGAAFAQTTEPATTADALPTWEQLSPAQRDTLLAPMRERWDAKPQQRGRLYQRAQRWAQLSPEQRTHARRGLELLKDMTPDQRENARAAFRKVRDLPPTERKALRERLKAMTPEQRKAWLEQGGNP